MISSYRTVTAVLMIAFCAVLVLGCGDTFRPTINVEPTPTGDPSSLQQALVLATNPAINAVTLIITNNLVASGNIPVGTEPVAVAGNANNGKVYVVNHGSNNVSVISTVDNSVIGSPIAVGSQPIWAVMSDDGTQVFVINQGGNSVTVIDTATDTVSDTITGYS